jgi:hypothetical protein
MLHTNSFYDVFDKSDVLRYKLQIDKRMDEGQTHSSLEAFDLNTLCK